MNRSSTKSPYTLSFWGQTRLCLNRGFWRLRADPTLTLTQLFGNFIMSLVIGSVFVNQSESFCALENRYSRMAGSEEAVETTASFRPRSAALFFAILINAFGAALEILTLYAQRPIVEKHTGYALLVLSNLRKRTALTFQLPTFERGHSIDAY